MGEMEEMENGHSRDGKQIRDCELGKVVGCACAKAVRIILPQALDFTQITYFGEPMSIDYLGESERFLRNTIWLIQTNTAMLRGNAKMCYLQTYILSFAPLRQRCYAHVAPPACSIYNLYVSEINRHSDELRDLISLVVKSLKSNDLHASRFS
jgi:hypothetical protein